jgi:NADH-quinone oxidoreductase subunit H
MTQFVFLLIKAVVVFFFCVGLAAMLIWGERKLAGFFQSRVGPNYAGPGGVLQTFGDLSKLLRKEDITPDTVDKPVFKIAPYILWVPAAVTMALIPFGPMGVTILSWQTDLVIANFDAGVVLFLAMGTVAIYGVVFAGWASNSHWALLGALRSGAQMVSYEIAMGLSLVGVMLLSGSLNFVEIVNRQSGNFWNWYFLPQIVGLAIFFIASIAELNRGPFDLPEAEQELVAGFMTEYSGMRWGIFMFAEYVNMIVMSAVISTLFFGGWRAPFSSWNVVPGFVWLLAKMAFFIFLYMWVRWTIPRYRYNQLMDIGWKVLLPLALANLAVTAIVVAVS